MNKIFGFLKSKKNNISYIGHCVLAQIMPFSFYLVSSYFGLTTVDTFFPIVATDLVTSGLLPCKGFMCIMLPGSFFLQAFLQKIFFFLPPIIISRLWKGLITIVLCGVFLVYINALLKRLNIKDKIPLFFLYIFSLFFMFIGSIHQPFSFYTFDALFFGSIGVLLVSWPGKNGAYKYWIKLIGYFSFGLAFPIKQDIGSVSVAAGFAFIIFGVVYKKIYKQKVNKILDVLLPSFLLLVSMSLLLIYYYSNGALNDLFYNTIVLPSQIRIGVKKLIFAILSIRLTMFTSLARLIIFTVISTVLSFWLVGKKRKDFLPYKLFLYFCSIGLIAFIIYLVFFSVVAPVSLNNSFCVLLAELSFLKIAIYRCFIFVFLPCAYFTILALCFSFFKMKIYRKMELFFFYFLPATILFFLFIFSTLVGINCPRLSMYSFPIVLSFFIVLICFLKRPESFNFSWRAINLSILVVVFVLLGLRFRAIIGDTYIFPMHRPMSYCKKLHTFLDSEVFREIEQIKQIVEKDKDSSFFVYNTDPFFYTLLNKKPITRSIMHSGDCWPRFMSNKEIKRIKDKKIMYILTPKKNGRNDKIFSYIYRNYDIVFVGKLLLFKIKNRKTMIQS